MNDPLNFLEYKKPLPQNTTLQLFNNDELIFSDSGKWLHPLFSLENFLQSYTGPSDNLCIHDTAVGKAAAVLMLRMGIKKIYANLASKLAENFIQQYNQENNTDVLFEYTNLVDRLLCATENQLESLSDINQMYVLLRQRAKLVQGVSVKIENLSYKFGNIHNLSFTLQAGQRLMIMGENGTGKTTLLRLIAGIYKSENGKILIDDKNISALPKYTIGYIPQMTDNTQFSLSVEEVVSLGLNNNSSENILKALERTSCLNLRGRSFSSLSGGEKQKVSLARALAQNAKLLLLDEPTASLDKENKKMVKDILLSLSLTEIPTIIIVTHDKDLYSMSNWLQLNLDETGITNG